MAAQQQDRRRVDKLQGAVPSTTQPPSLTHHHSMNSSNGNAQQVSSIAPNPSAGRPGIERAHTFPTPPTSASGTMTSIGSQQGSYDWTNGGAMGPVPNGQGMGLESHPQSTPATPATTPPNTALPSLQSYQSQQQLYAGQAGSQTQYPSQQQSMARTGSISSGMYSKHDMGPPSRVGPSRPESEHGDLKLDTYGQQQHTDNSHPGGDAEADADQEPEYHSNAQAYGSHRGSFDAYNTNPTLASYNGDNTHIASDVGGSAVVNGGSGRGTPRTSQTWTTPGYATPPRAPPSSNLYNPTSDARGSLANGNADPGSYVPGAYAPTQMNGVKRVRDDDDVEVMKRQKLSTGTIGGSFDADSRPMNRPRTNAAKPTRVR